MTESKYVLTIEVGPLQFEFTTWAENEDAARDEILTIIAATGGTPSLATVRVEKES